MHRCLKSRKIIKIRLLDFNVVQGHQCWYSLKLVSSACCRTS